jgi:hypothetical protein
MVVERIKKIVSEPYKCKTSFGVWGVRADASFYSEETGRAWDYPAKSFNFWRKADADKFIIQNGGLK